MTTPDTTPDSALNEHEPTQASPATTDALLTLEGVSKIYGDLHALDNVSLEIPRGQWVSIVGPSGSGKTTLMNIVGAMDTATKGTVML
ncbi:ATP-binding cassette domain-containing protein, partial [Actinomyces bouchesdurhonensis]